jgi:nitrate/nitrite-specific signal transduction histidine kinase
LLSAEGCSLYLISENKLQLKESNYLPTSYLGREKPVSTGPKSGLTAWVAASDEVIQSNHQEYKKYKAWAGESDHLQYLPSKKLNSLLIVPICLPGQAPVGVLKLENKTSSTGPGEFNREDVDNLLYLAQQLALALEVVKQYERIQKWERIGLEDDLHELVNWYHNGVVLFLEKLRIDLEEDDLESAKRLIGEIVHRAITTTVELKTIHTAVTRKYFEIEEFDRGLREMVDAWKNRESGRNYDLSIDVSCPTDIQLQPEVRNRLLRIASGAVSNAIRHSGIRYDPGIKIKVTVESFDHRLKMTVQDTGVGMVKIEPKFGIGRMMQLVDQLKTIGYDADIRLISEPGQGTTVTVYLGLEPSNQMVEAQRVMGAQFS